MPEQLSASPITYVVFASPKSGTEWVRRMLSAHPEAHCAETRAWGDWFDPANPTAPHISLQKYVSFLVSYHGTPGRTGAAGAADAERYARALTGRLWREIARAALEASGKRIYGEKITPFDGTALEVVRRLAEFDPGLRFIHLVRDGRDVVVSGLAHQRIIHERKGSEMGRQLGEAVDRRQVPGAILERFCSFWADTCAAAEEAEELFGRFLRVRYEDLLVDTAGQMRRLLGFIGADDSAGACAACAGAGDFAAMSGGRRRGEEDLSSVVRKGVAGDWVNWFSEQQAAQFAERCGRWLEAYGYAASGPTLRGGCEHALAAEGGQT